MRIKSVRRACAVASVVVVAAGTPMAMAAVNSSSSPATSATTGAAATSPLDTAGLPSTQQQTNTLNSALTYMRANYKSLYQNYGGDAVTAVFDYGIGSLWQKGTDGAGTTIAVLEAWADPQVQANTDSFFSTLHLPNPQIQTIYPDGPLPSTCPAQTNKTTGSCASWEGEEDTDIDAIHLMAPYAKILVAVTPPDSQEADDPASNGAPPEFMKSLETISSGHLANAISISAGNGESTYSEGATEIHAQDPGELAAAAAGIPVVAASGDSGVVEDLPTPYTDNGGYETTKTPGSNTWDDSPWVTAVGGTTLNMSSQTPTKLGADPLWSQESAGYSSVYSRPSYQNGVSSAPMRSVPDISMDAEAGTSEAAPMLAGVLALATQSNQGDLGPINPALYGVLGPAGSRDGISDVVSGNNTMTVSPSGANGPTYIVQGYAAGPGFDVASGWGTVYTPNFVPALVTATRASDQEAASRAQAQSQLNQLQHGATVTKTSSGNYYLNASGLLPGHPAQLAIDGKTIATLTVNQLGDITYMIDPTQLKLGGGQHTVTLTSMLLTETGQF